MTSPLQNETHKKWEGRVVNGKFPLHQYLGTTNSRAVFLTELSDGKKAVIKLVPVTSQTKDKLLFQWQRIAKISHPNLLQFYESGRCELNGASLMLLYAVMEYADVDLARVLVGRPITPAETQEMLKPLLEVLADVHSRGLVHAQIHPSNIMAVGETIKLSSDSLCTPEEFKAMRMVRKATMYDAPEIAKGEISVASDVWSLGVTLIEALTLRQPVMATAEGLSPDDLKKIQPVQPEQIPSPFIDIVRNSLRLKPKMRWNIAEISTRLAFANFMAHTPGIAHVAGPEEAIPISQEVHAKEPFAKESIAEPTGIQRVDWDEEPLFAQPHAQAGFVNAEDAAHLELVPAELFEEPAAVAHLSESALSKSALSESALGESGLNESILSDAELDNIAEEDQDFDADLEHAIRASESNVQLASVPKKALPKWTYYVPFAAAALAIVIFIPKHHSAAAPAQAAQVQAATPNPQIATQAVPSTFAPIATQAPVTRRSRREREANEDVAQTRRSRRHRHQSDSPIEQASVVEPAPAAPAPSIAPAANTISNNANDNAKGGIVHQVLPRIPKEIRKDIQNPVLVWVHVSVDPAGHVTNTSFDSAGPNPDIAQHVLQAAQQWRFSAPHVNGEKVAAEWTLRFTLARDSMRVVPVQVTP